MKWNYGACGEYADYMGYTIIKQDHPKLDKYEITILSNGLELRHVCTASTIKEAKEIIKSL